MAEIKRREALPANDLARRLIPFLTAARNEKIAQQKAQADNSTSQAYKNAYQLWLQLGVATQDIADILGIEKGAKTLDKIKADYSTGKPYYNPNTGVDGGIPGVPSQFTD
jgi:geranylgeranyl pyrophosphate synthase